MLTPEPHPPGVLQVNKALIWLGAGGKGPPRPLAAALALKELAVAMPAVFNMHVRTFINSIWTGIRHPALPVRHASVDALRVSLFPPAFTVFASFGRILY